MQFGDNGMMKGLRNDVDSPNFLNSFLDPQNGLFSTATKDSITIQMLRYSLL